MAKDEHNRDVNEKLPGEKPEGTHHFKRGSVWQVGISSCGQADARREARAEVVKRLQPSAAVLPPA
jgi:hypothetical protein